MLTEKEQTVVAKATTVMPKGKKKMSASLLSTDTADWIKVLLQGHTGSGKTMSLSGVLQTVNREGRPTKVFVASTDIGGNGLRSVKEDLRAKGMLGLLDNLAWIEFSTYEDFAAFTSNPNTVEVGGKTLWDWNPDVICWDGVSNFQESLVWRYIMSIDPLSSDASEARTEGIQAGLAEYGQIRRSTILQIDQLVSLHNPNGKKIHKIATVLLDDGKEDKLSHETKKGPLIIGAARSYLGPAFDLILTTVANVKPGMKTVEYSYRCDLGSGTVAKIRGVKLPEEALKKADMKALWSSLTGINEEVK